MGFKMGFKKFKYLCQKGIEIKYCYILAILLGIIIASLCFQSCYAEDKILDKGAWRAIIGEASDQGYDGMLAVAVGIRNRGSLYGVYGINAPHVDKEPEWVWKLARKAWKESEHNRIHAGTHWENVKEFGEPYWVKDMVEVYKIKDHVFYKKMEVTK